MCVSIQIVNDLNPEDDESFNVNFLFPTPDGVIYVSPTIATVTIGDDGILYYRAHIELYIV